MLATQAKVQIALCALVALSGAAAISRQELLRNSIVEQDDPKPVWPTNFLINFTESASVWIHIIHALWQAFPVLLTYPIITNILLKTPNCTAADRFDNGKRELLL